MARLLADENFPRPTVDELRRLGHDALTMRDIGRAGLGTPDDVVLELATADRRTVLTTDRRDFMRLDRIKTGHAGIVICTFDPDFVALAMRIDAALAASGSLDGRLIRVVRPGPGSR
jgi:predicted nuclease of predicted toxin-antitoxin system